MKKQLLNKYGNSHLKGFKLIAYILEHFKYPIHSTMGLYGILSEEFKMSKYAVERDISTYKNKVGYKDITNSEFITQLLIEVE